jgi:fluoride exporter
MTKNMIIVAIGGATGAVLRYLVSVVTSKYYMATFPLATLLVNSVGCLLIGVFIGLFSKSILTNPELRLLLITGFCGGFTTFSAFAQENISLMQSNNPGTAILYTIVSIVTCFTFVWVGQLIIR